MRLEYGQVTKMLGNGRVEVLCIDGVARLCHIRGKLRKKVTTSFLPHPVPFSFFQFQSLYVVFHLPYLVAVAMEFL